MVPVAAAAAVADGWFAFVSCRVNSKHLCYRDEDPHCAPKDPFRRWLDDAAVPIAADSVASILSCNTIVVQCP